MSFFFCRIQVGFNNNNKTLLLKKEIVIKMSIKSKKCIIINECIYVKTSLKIIE